MIYSINDPNHFGDAMHWWPSFESRRVVGWKPRRPLKGDLLKAKMQSGKVMLFKFVEVQHMRDPYDMFFGRVREIGYEDEAPFGMWPRMIWMMRRLASAIAQWQSSKRVPKAIIRKKP